MSDEPFDLTDAIHLLRSVITHRAYLAEALSRVSATLDRRGMVHDLSKLGEGEFAGFSRINGTARHQKFGSPEYAESMRREAAVIAHHFLQNRHHAERPRLMAEAAEVERGLPDDFTYVSALTQEGMTFIDVIEMVCDWWAARKGYGDNDRSWFETVHLNLEQKGKYLSDWQKGLVYSVAQFLEATHGG